VRCVQCGAYDCQGCVAAVNEAHSALAWELLPWELLPLKRPEIAHFATHRSAVNPSLTASPAAIRPAKAVYGWFQRLWLTARFATESPQRLFGQLPDGPLGSAIVFATVCETLALGSLWLLGLGVCVVALGTEGTWVLLSHWGGALAGLLAATVGFMVGVHLWAGLCTELGALGDAQGFELKAALRFALYTCGWDFITSPIGLLVAILQLGPRRGTLLLRQATNALRPAWQAYSEQRRGLSARARRIGAILGIASFAALAVIACVASVVWVLQRFR
jgi:hypothetical protein